MIYNQKQENLAPIKNLNFKTLKLEILALSLSIADCLGKLQQKGLHPKDKKNISKREVLELSK